LALGSVLAVLAVLTSAVGVVTPAQAYGTLVVRWARVDTDDCHRFEGNLPVVAHAAGCELRDSADGTFLRRTPAASP
jgi:hypothetical protein